MLILNETYEQRKAWLLDYIKVCRELSKVINDLIKKNPQHNELGTETIGLLHTDIGNTMKELVELKQWLKKEGIAPDEPYLPRRLREEMKNWTDEQWDEHYNKKLIIAQKIDELKLKGGYYE